MSFENFLKEHAQSIEIELDKILLEFLKQTKKTNSKLVPFAKKLVNSCKGGKRIRGVLVKMGYEIATGSSNPRNDVVRAGVAFEILHTALLIHDDIIDKSPTRRGRASLYQTMGGNHYGISQAITLGDIGLYLPIKIITSTKFSDEIKIRALSYFSQILINTGWGQVMDLEKDKDIAWVNLFKTAKYTIAGPLQIGVILAGVSPTHHRLPRIREFGENLGIAFQIRDDILDGVKGSEKEAVKYVNVAKKMIPRITKDEKMKEILENMADYVVERRK